MSTLDARHVVLTVVGAALGLAGLVAAIAGGPLLWASLTGRDGSGFFRSPEVALTTSTHALTSDRLAFVTHPGDWLPAEGQLTARVDVTSTTTVPVFVGLAHDNDLRAYLAGVSHERITDLRSSDGVATERRAGGAPAGPPGDQTFWVRSSVGLGTQSLEWDVQAGTYQLVVMNADGSPAIGVRAAAGVASSLVAPLAAGMVVAGLMVLLLGVLLVTAGSRSGWSSAERRGPDAVTRHAPTAWQEPVSTASRSRASQGIRGE